MATSSSPLILRTTQPVTVNLRYDKRTKTLAPPRTITLHLCENQEVRWACEEARCEINFDPQTTPFFTSRFRVPLGGSILSGVPSRRRAREQTLRYTVTVLAINQPNAAAKKRCCKVRLVSPVRAGKPLPMAEGKLTIRLRKPEVAG